MNEEFVSIGKAAKYLGMSIDGLRKWEADGVLIPERTPTGHRRYRMNDLKTLMHEKPSRQQTTSCVIYARVSTKKQEDAGNLDRQIGRLSAFATEKGWRIVDVVTDTASGLNENRRGLQKVLQKIANQEISKVVVEYKDRLARFGFSYLTAYAQAFGGEIIVMDQEEKDEQQELVEDLIAITTSFSARIYGTRGGNKLVDAVQTVLQTDDEPS